MGKTQPYPKTVSEKTCKQYRAFFHFVKSKEYYYNFADFMNNNGAKTNGLMAIISAKNILN